MVKTALEPHTAGLQFQCLYHQQLCRLKGSSQKLTVGAASCPVQKYHSSSRFPSLFLSSLESFLVLFLRAKLLGQAGRMRCIVINTNFVPTQMIDGTEKPIRSLQTRSAIQRTLEIWSTLPSYRSLYFVMSDRGYQ